MFVPAMPSGNAALSRAPPASPMLGFNEEDALKQEHLENVFDAQLNAAELRTWLKEFSSAPNNVGTSKDKENAELILRRFKEWGWEAHIETYYVLYPTPKMQTLELVAPTQYAASLREPAVAGDLTSEQNRDALPPYAAYGADGDVSGDLVYVNGGTTDDYKELARRGIEVKGRIVIARYDGGWRGLKPKLAYEHGAVGCIIYSDPRDDGYFQGDVYPSGGWRPREGVQRGSVLDLPVYPGDPLTPGWGATRDARRLSLADAKTVLKIPVIPVSYADALPFLRALYGPVAPSTWRGSLPITYHLGPGPGRAHMYVRSNWDLEPVYDVIAIVRGTEAPDQWVIRGNHHDGWTYGAWDPLSGTVALLQEAKAIGALLKAGWKPKRTLIYASWDGEEPGLMGSTEWVEAHAEELRKKAVVYVNSDTNARGFLAARGSQSLQRLLNEVAAGVTDPETGVSVQQRLRAKMRIDAYEDRQDEGKQLLAKLAGANGDLPITALGSGSDYTPFIQHLGVATLDMSYEGEGEDDGVYHSDYDTFEHYIRFGDPAFRYGITEAETVGHVVLRLINADLLPFEFEGFAEAVERYLSEVRKLADEKRDRARDLGSLLAAQAFALAGDPTHPVGPPEPEPEVPDLQFAPIDNALVQLRKSAKGYSDAYRKTVTEGTKLSAGRRREVNALLRSAEYALTDPQGLPGREWFKHMIYAPGLYTGYGVKTLPGIREAIEQNRWEEANRYTTIVATALNRYSAIIDRAASILSRAQQGGD